MNEIKVYLQQLISQALEALDLPRPDKINFEHPAKSEHGEWSCNVAMVGFRGKGLGLRIQDSGDGIHGAGKTGKLENGNMAGRDVVVGASLVAENRIPSTGYRSPRELAQVIVDQLYSQLTSDPSHIISKIEVAGPGFINFYLSDVFYVTKIGTIVQQQGKVRSEVPTGKTAIVEFSSPNIAKPFTVGHLRSTIIGAAVANLLEAVGYSVLRDNHLGDWGTQFGKQIYAIKTWGDEEEIANSDRPVKKLVDLYMKFHEEAEKDPSIEDQGRAWFKKLEDGDPEARALWQKCIDWSWVEFYKIYEQLHVSFSPELNNGRGLGESFFEDKMSGVIEELEQHPDMYKTGENGAKLFFFPEDVLPPLMILKKDGATLYATRDLATDKYRKATYNPDLIVNEVGGEQALYFKQIYEIEKILGWYQDGQRVHVKHGLYRFKDKKMSTRKGNVIWLEDVLAEAVKRAAVLGEGKGERGKGEGKIGKSENREDLQATNHQSLTTNSVAIGIGALKWNDLRRSSELDIVFDWDEILNMEGNSGPYMQYTYVRTRSIWKKFEALAGTDLPKWQELLKNFHLQGYQINPEEQAVLVSLTRFEEAVTKAAEQLAPHHVCTYLYELAQSFNSFYNKHSVLGKPENWKIGEENDIAEEMLLRLKITQATMVVIAEGLRLLGIEVVEEM